MTTSITRHKMSFILSGLLTLCVILATIGYYVLQGKEDTPKTWYVEKGLVDNWARILHKGEAPERFAEIQIWDGKTIPEGPGILIATKPRQNPEKIKVYYRLSYDLEYNGAIVLAVDPWMVFCKYSDPMLTLNWIYAVNNGNNAGVLLIPGQDPNSVQAWKTRLMQSGPGAFSAPENRLFETNLFPRNAQTYTWQDVFYRLMGTETAWVYAPLSAIRHYPNFRKSILTAAPFPEPYTSRYSLQATLLWAVPLGSPEEQKKMENTIAWLKKPETQTVIADNLEWIPADPYGKPYDPVSLASHRNWLTATYIYEVP